MPKYKIMRDCCTSGNCLHCNKLGTDPQPHGQPARVEQWIGEDEQLARAIMTGWERYNPTLIEEAS